MLRQVAGACHNRRKYQEIQRHPAVPERAEHIGNHVVKDRCFSAEKDDKHIRPGVLKNVVLHLHPDKNLSGKKGADHFYVRYLFRSR